MAYFNLGVLCLGVMWPNLGATSLNLSQVEGRAIRKLVGMWKEGIVTLKRSIDLLGSIGGC